MATKKTRRHKYMAEFSVGALAKKSWPLSVTIPRTAGDDNEDMPAIGGLLIDAQLEMKATVIAKGEVEGQQTMDCAESIPAPLKHIVTCGSSVKFTATHVSFRLSLPMDADPAQMKQYAFQSGKIELKRIGDRPTGEQTESEEEESGD